MKKFILVFSTLLIVAVVGLIWVLKPYISYQTVRVDDTPVSFEVEYINVTGDPLCSKFYLVVDDQVSDKAMLPRVPSDIPDPHEVKNLNQGDRITIKGYRYQWIAENMITGGVRKRSVGLTDVVAWQGPDGLSHQSDSLEEPTSAFSGRNYTDCL